MKGRRDPKGLHVVHPHPPPSEGEGCPYNYGPISKFREKKPALKVENVGKGEGGSFSVDSRISRGGSNPYGHIWILTLKRIYAEGLQ
jgi:hypothetical protein